MTQLPYMQERWYQLLVAAVEKSSQRKVATLLGSSTAQVCQVMNGTGEYGKGKASTDRFAEKVLHQLGSYACPHLTEQNGQEQVITADQCRVYAHRNPPIGSPRDLAHWQACRKCPHLALSAPPQPRVPVPRKRKAAGPGQPQHQDEVTSS